MLVNTKMVDVVCFVRFVLSVCFVLFWCVLFGLVWFGLAWLGLAWLVCLFVCLLCKVKEVRDVDPFYTFLRYCRSKSMIADRRFSLNSP